MAPKSTKAADFLAKLDRGDVVGNVFQLIGLAKKGTSKATFGFSPGRLCRQWVMVPEEAVDDVDILGEIACAEHSHPLIRLTLKAPSTSDGKLFAELLIATTTQERISLPESSLLMSSFSPIRTNFPKKPDLPATAVDCPNGYFLWQDPDTGKLYCRSIL